MKPLVPNNKEKPTRTHRPTLCQIARFTCFMKSDNVSVRYTIVGGMLDPRFAMVETHMFARLISVFSVKQPDSQPAS